MRVVSFFAPMYSYSLNTRFMSKKITEIRTIACSSMTMAMNKQNHLYQNYKPKTNNQIKYNNLLNNNNIKLVVSVGSAGTGKTMFACQNAVAKLSEHLYDKILITRPVVSVDEDIGFLPGSLNKKMNPWIRPIMDIFEEYNLPKNSNCVEISPLGFMRGRTFKNFYIVADEMQNSTPAQMIMLLTRMGENSKMVITGDLNQSDNQNGNGLKDFIEKINKYYENNEKKMNDDGIGIVYFNEHDIHRSPLVSKILNIYSNE